MNPPSACRFPASRWPTPMPEPAPTSAPWLNGRAGCNFKAAHAMKKKAAATKQVSVAMAKPTDLAALIIGVRDLIQSARRGGAAVVDTYQVMTHFDYDQIGQQPAAKLSSSTKSQKPSDQLGIQQKVSVKSNNLFTISWSHYVLLLGIKDPEERSFYEIEATNEGWFEPELRRQKASCLYERLALSRGMQGIKRLALEGQLITKPEDLFKEPLVLEFLGLEAQASYSESDLKSALISHLEKDANIHAKDYQLSLPSKELLRQKLLDWCGEEDVAERDRKTKGTAQCARRRMNPSRFKINDRLVLRAVTAANGQFFLMDLLGKALIINRNQLLQARGRPRFWIPVIYQRAALPLANQQAGPFKFIQLLLHRIQRDPEIRRHRPSVSFPVVIQMQQRRLRRGASQNVRQRGQFHDPTNRSYDLQFKSINP